MKYEFNSINTSLQFHNLNQWDETITKQMCTYYAPAINLKYNCWIELTEKDLKTIAKKDAEAGKFWFNKWGYGKTGVKSVYTYVKENAKKRGWKIPNLVTFWMFETWELNKWLERSYASVVWINVNKNFYLDIQDRNINNFEDYVNYVWNRGHFTNIAKWLKGDKHDMIIDSYMKKWGSTYRCDIGKLLNKVTMRTKYIFY